MLFIHCGLHKTGSTAIQNAFNNYYRNFIFSQKSYHKLDSDRLDDKWVAAIKSQLKNKNIILSSEFALGTYKDQYKNYKLRLDSIKSSFSCCDVKIIVFLREPISWIESIYTQYIQEGSTISAENFLSSYLMQASPFDYWQFALNLYNVFGKNNVILRLYSSNVVSDFSSITGVKPRINNYSFNNKSLKYSRLHLLKALNKDLEYSEQHNIRLLLQSLNTNHMQKCAFSNSQVDRIKSIYQQSWHHLLNDELFDLNNSAVHLSTTSNISTYGNNKALFDNLRDDEIQCLQQLFLEIAKNLNPHQTFRRSIFKFIRYCQLLASVPINKLLVQFRNNQMI